MRRLYLVVILAIIVIGLAYAIYLFLGARQLGMEQKVIIVDAAPIAKPLFDNVIPFFENQTGIKVQVSYEASGVIFSKLREGVPLDVVVFASQDWGLKALNQGLVYPEPTTGVGYQIVLLYIRSTVPYNITCIDDLANYPIRVGIANPDVAPAGLEALKIINQSSNADTIRGKIVVANDIAQLVTWYKLGSVDAAFIWNNFMGQLKNYTKNIVYPWKCGYNTSIYYTPAYVSKTSKNIEAAKQFVVFLNSDYVKNVAKRLGFFASLDEARRFMESASS
ncbi:molybdate ABC transporter substrate-binding protein [Thermogladius sp. 4427co]|uniref:molybdate ABC transporter substrate-binding protein n=1 Tax=Thermogladius sp. 4427co TaxID=3450718 RepID=UPI003F78E9F1